VPGLKQSPGLDDDVGGALRHHTESLDPGWGPPLGRTGSKGLNARSRRKKNISEFKMTPIIKPAINWFINMDRFAR